MPKGIPNKRYTGEFKQMVVETMRNEQLGCREAGRRFEVAAQRICEWERIYLTEGPDALYIERRGRGSKGNAQGRPPRFDKKLEEDLLAENQRLRAEIAYLKKLQALVLEEEQHKSKKRK
jgi:transposase-like protein